jgi:ketosteroid isomerase-like protein
MAGGAMAHTTESNKQIVRRLLETAARDPRHLGDFLAEDLTWTIPCDAAHAPFAGTLGKTQLLAQFAGLAQMMPGGLHYTIQSLTAEDNRVACEAEGKGDSALGPFCNRYHFLFELRDGKVCAAREYCDSAYVAAFVQRAARE